MSTPAEIAEIEELIGYEPLPPLSRQTALQAMLKELYTPNLVAQLLHPKNPFLDMIKKQVKEEQEKLAKSKL